MVTQNHPAEAQFDESHIPLPQCVARAQSWIVKAPNDGDWNFPRHSVLECDGIDNLLHRDLLDILCRQKSEVDRCDLGGHGVRDVHGWAAVELYWRGFGGLLQMPLSPQRFGSSPERLKKFFASEVSG